MDPKVYTTKDHLPGEDTVVVSLYERFVELTGPVDRSNILLAGWSLVLQCPLQDERIREVKSYTKGLFGNQCRVASVY
jgi:hypothetical protein